MGDASKRATSMYSFVCWIGHLSYSNLKSSKGYIMNFFPALNIIWLINKHSHNLVLLIKKKVYFSKKHLSEIKKKERSIPAILRKALHFMFSYKLFLCEWFLKNIKNSFSNSSWLCDLCISADVKWKWHHICSYLFTLFLDNLFTYCIILSSFILTFFKLSISLFLFFRLYV